jgi:hypothetical protein
MSGLQGSYQAPYQPAGQDDLQLIVNGQAWQGWQQISVTRGCEQVPATFDIINNICDGEYPSDENPFGELDYRPGHLFPQLGPRPSPQIAPVRRPDPPPIRPAGNPPMEVQEGRSGHGVRQLLIPPTTRPHGTGDRLGRVGAVGGAGVGAAREAAGQGRVGQPAGDELLRFPGTRHRVRQPNCLWREYRFKKRLRK